MIPITSRVVYDPGMDREYHSRCRSNRPMICLEPRNGNWAIIPTQTGKSYHSVFFYGQGGLPAEIQQEFLKKDIVTECGYALAYKRVIGLHAQNGKFYKTHRPSSIHFRGDEIWGDYYYAALYCSLCYALERECERLAFFPTYGMICKWQWEALVRAAHNAMEKSRPDDKLAICVICCGLPDDFPRNQEPVSLLQHAELPYARAESYADTMDLLTFLPRDSFPIPT
jgi:hypothetical protein